MSKEKDAKTELSVDKEVEETGELARQELLHLIDEEIAEVKAVARAGGWTVWAVWGALASLFWIASKEIQAGKISWEAIAHGFLLMMVISSLVKRCFPGRPSHVWGLDNQARFYKFDEFFSGGVRFFLWRLLSAAGLLALAVYLGFAAKGLEFLVWFYLTGNVLLYLFAGVFLLSNLPISEPQPGKRQLFIQWSIFSMVVLVNIGCIVVVSMANEDIAQRYEVDEIRLSAIFLGGWILLDILMKGHPRMGLLSELIAIRRSLCLQTLTLKAASERAEIALLGTKLSDVLQKELEAVLEAVRSADEACSMAHEEMLSFQSNISDRKNLSEDEKKIAVAVARSVGLRLRSIKSSVDVANNATKRYIRKCSFLLAMNPDVREDAKLLQAKMKSQLGTLMSRLDKLGETNKSVDEYFGEKAIADYAAIIETPDASEEEKGKASGMRGWLLF